MTEDFQLLDDDIPKAQGRCDQCKYFFGRPTPQEAVCLRCPGCDFPFGERLEGVRAIARALQTPRTRLYTNVYSQVVCYVWLQVVRDNFDDLTVEPYDLAESFGTVPDWYAYEFENISWPEVLAPSQRWALQEGLCPGQQFLVEFKQPRYSQGSWEYPSEYDVDYFWEVVDRAPRSAKQAARAWELWQRHRHHQDA